MGKNTLIKRMQRYPSIIDLQKRAKKRIPHVAWEYLDCGTGDERAVSRNLEKMAEVTLVPKLLKGDLNPDITTTLFGQSYEAPLAWRLWDCPL